MQNQLASALREKGLTQSALAEACGVDKSAVSRWVKWGLPVPEKHLETVEKLTGLPRERIAPASERERA